MFVATVGIPCKLNISLKMFFDYYRLYGNQIELKSRSWKQIIDYNSQSKIFLMIYF